MNAVSSIFNTVRHKVSADKNRYKEYGYDLDLTFITDRVIAMAFPADGVEATYRNHIDDVAELLRTHHQNHYLIYNLSNRNYDITKFEENRVLKWCGFPDHHPPPLFLLFKIVHSMCDWLKQDPENIAVVHCLAGKGRTGTVIASFFLYCGLFSSMEEALTFFSYRRSLNCWGVTGPSQLRYLNYFERIFHRTAIPHTNTMQIQTIHMSPIPRFTIRGGEQGVTPYFEIFQLQPERVKIFSTEITMEDIPSYHIKEGEISFSINCIVSGDVLIQCYHLDPHYETEPIFHFGFNVGMIGEKIVSKRWEIEKAEKDSRFPSDFQVTVSLEPYTDLEFKRSQSEREMHLSLFMKRLPDCEMDGLICFTGPPDLQQNLKLVAQDIGNPTTGRLSVKGGWLIDLEPNSNRWKRSWFVLRAGVITLHKSPRDVKAHAEIPLDSISSLHLVEQPIGKWEACFEIRSTRASYFISAFSESHRQSWVNGIQYACTRIKSKRKLRSSNFSDPTPFLNSQVDSSTFTAILYPFETSAFECSAQFLTLQVYTQESKYQRNLTLISPNSSSVNLRSYFLSHPLDIELKILGILKFRISDTTTLLGEIEIDLSQEKNLDDRWFSLSQQSEGPQVKIKFHLDLNQFCEDYKHAQEMLLLHHDRKFMGLHNRASSVSEGSNNTVASPMKDLLPGFLGKIIGQDSDSPSRTPSPVSPAGSRRGLPLPSLKKTTDGLLNFLNLAPETPQEASSPAPQLPTTSTNKISLLRKICPKEFSIQYCAANEKYLYLADSKGVLHCWRKKTGIQAFSVKVHVFPVDQLVCANGNIWSAAGNEIAVTNSTKGSVVKCMRFNGVDSWCLGLVSMDGYQNIWAGARTRTNEGKVYVWRADTTENVCKINTPASVHCLDWDPENDVVWAGGMHHITAYDRKFTQLCTFDTGTAVVELVKSFHHILLVLYRGETQIAVWDVATKSIRCMLNKHTGPVRDLLLVGECMVSCGNANELFLWNLNELSYTFTLDTLHDRTVNQLFILGNNLFGSVSNKLLVCWKHSLTV